jgi:hypothetical protein
MTTSTATGRAAASNRDRPKRTEAGARAVPLQAKLIEAVRS